MRVAITLVVLAAYVAMAMAIRNEGRYLQYYWDGLAESHKGGNSCIPFTESSPKAFRDNWLCVLPTQNIEEIGLKYINDGSVAGKVPGDMKCISLNKNDAPHILDTKETIKDWADNYLCLPAESHLDLFWAREQSKSPRYDCIEISESDWDARWLCAHSDNTIIDCEVSEWSSFDGCSTSCGNGTQIRTRTVKVSPSNGGASCPPLIERRACNLKECGASLETTPQKVLFWVCAAMITVEALVVMLLVAPLPKGYRARLIESTSQLAAQQPVVKGLAAIAALFSVVLFGYSAYARQQLAAVAANATAGGARVDCRRELEWALLGDDYERDMYLSGFALFVLMLLFRVGHVLWHYIRLAQGTAPLTSTQAVRARGQVAAAQAAQVATIDGRKID